MTARYTYYCAECEADLPGRALAGTLCEVCGETLAAKEDAAFKAMMARDLAKIKQRKEAR